MKVAQGNNYGVLRNSPAKDKIKRYLAGEAATLTEPQQQLFARWSRADELMQQSEALQDIVRILIKEFNVSSVTAHRDIFDAQEVFGNARHIDKIYIVYNAWQRAEATRKLIAEEIEAKNLYRDPKMLAALAKWEELCMGYINSFPVKEIAKLPTKTIINMVLPQGEAPINTDADLLTLLQKADSYLKNASQLNEINEDDADTADGE